MEVEPATDRDALGRLVLPSLPAPPSLRPIERRTAGETVAEHGSVTAIEQSDLDRAVTCSVGGASICFERD